MTEEIEVIDETAVTSTPPFLTTVRRVLMAGIGVVALAQEEIEEFVNKLVERGEIAEKDGRKLLNDLRERRQKTQDSAQERVQTATNGVANNVDRRMDGMLERLNIPSKSDIESLSEKIALLSDKVDELKAQQES